MPQLGVIRLLSRLSRGTRQLKEDCGLLSSAGPPLDRGIVAQLNKRLRGRKSKSEPCNKSYRNRELGSLFEGYVSWRAFRVKLQTPG
jgi:hypothetical protein